MMLSVNCMAQKFPVIVSGPFIVNKCGFAVLVWVPVQLLNIYPPAAEPEIWTETPAGIHGPGGVLETVPAPAGLGVSVSRYSACQTHVIVEAWLIVKLMLALEPDAGTLPVPVQPVHTYLVPVGPAMGVVTEQFTDVPLL